MKKIIILFGILMMMLLGTVFGIEYNNITSHYLNVSGGYYVTFNITNAINYSIFNTNNVSVENLYDKIWIAYSDTGSLDERRAKVLKSIYHDNIYDYNLYLYHMNISDVKTNYKPDDNSYIILGHVEQQLLNSPYNPNIDYQIYYNFSNNTYTNNYNISLWYDCRVDDTGDGNWLSSIYLPNNTQQSDGERIVYINTTQRINTFNTSNDNRMNNIGFLGIRVKSGSYYSGTLSICKFILLCKNMPQVTDNGGYYYGTYQRTPSFNNGQMQYAEQINISIPDIDSVPPKQITNLIVSNITNKTLVGTGLNTRNITFIATWNNPDDIDFNYSLIKLYETILIKALICNYSTSGETFTPEDCNNSDWIYINDTYQISITTFDNNGNENSSEVVYDFNTTMIFNVVTIPEQTQSNETQLNAVVVAGIIILVITAILGILIPSMIPFIVIVDIFVVLCILLSLIF
jgi:hypothetical protein